jgi:hypothetical protein
VPRSPGLKPQRDHPVATATFGYFLILRISDEAALMWLKDEGSRRPFERGEIGPDLFVAACGWG